MSDPRSQKLPWVTKLSYGVGHVLNDLLASMWFSYLLVYLHAVLGFNNVLAGNLMLIGQVSDAVFTPFIGFESDRTNGFCGYGKRKSWHLLGTICCICSFPFLFNACITCEHSAMWAQFIYYSPFVVIFQFGWASTQISHLSLIPDLTSNSQERVELNAIRYAFTVISNLLVYLITWLMLDIHQTDSAKGDGNGDGTLSIQDTPKFRLRKSFQDITFIVVGLGAVFSIIFHIGVKERKHEFEGSEEDKKSVCNTPHISSTFEDSDEEKRPLIRQLKIKKCLTVTDWLKQRQFYQIGLLYMFTRLVVNISQIYLPMYLTDTLSLKKHFIAIIPLIVYISGFIASFLMKPVNYLVGSKGAYMLGVICVVGSCVGFWFIRTQFNLIVFAPAVFLGAGGSTILVTSLSMTSDLIGENMGSGAFVYGAMSFTDKLSNGVAVLLIQKLHPCGDLVACCAACEWYYRDILCLVPGGCAVLAFIVLITLLPFTIGKLNVKGTNLQENDTPKDRALKNPIENDGIVQTWIRYVNYRFNGMSVHVHYDTVTDCIVGIRYVNYRFNGIRYVNYRFNGMSIHVHYDTVTAL
ncbi:unnamed protein product [Owenia fusiformis]|uniref:Major facilitator superfamily domain-containing protein 12 n=1 Tax=Owenia fusiformis TaxID=6347 RepID=A0A8S4PQ84_OWEFU|nr:unnamed protein product [Owenia fusiformis]